MGVGSLAQAAGALMSFDIGRECGVELSEQEIESSRIGALTTLEMCGQQNHETIPTFNALEYSNQQFCEHEQRDI